MIKGYKGMNPDMTCRGMQFELGKDFHVDGNIEICQNGLHFCERLVDVFAYYDRDKSRFFQVEAYGTIEKRNSKSVASDLRIIHELTETEINQTVYGSGFCTANILYYAWHGYEFEHGNGYGSGNNADFGNGSGNRHGDGCGNGDNYEHIHGGGNIQEILIFME